MTEIIQKNMEGVVKFYKLDEGWGFIGVTNGEDEFVHGSHLKCSPPYEGEKVLLDTASTTSSEHKHQAVNVRRPEYARKTGDILSWCVEPGSWRTHGRIAPHEGGDALPFSSRDFTPTSTRGNPKPRPWHAASYVVTDTKTGPIAVDIELDTRYPLQRFAFLGPEEELIHKLQKMALPENCAYRQDSGDKRFPILYNYVHFTFAKLCDEDRELRDSEKKIRLREDLSEPLAAFNTGLVDEKYKSIYALLEQNEPQRAQRWKFRAFCIPGVDHGKLLASYFNPLPKPAQYFASPADLLYDPTAPLHPDYEHIFKHNRNRLPEELLQQVNNMNETSASKMLTMHLDSAIETAKKRAQWNYRTAIPHYFPSFKRLQFLLPLSLISDDHVDVALSVQKTDAGYLGHTILPLDWAYKSARLVCRPDSDWLAPERIDEAPDDSDVDEVP